MNREDLALTDTELENFNEFLNEHSKCSTNEALVAFYNVKLVYNINSKHVPVVTAICLMCESEELITEPTRILNETRD